MNQIKLLDKQTASKIAAGEVIERPAGVLKELIENSLDARAAVINIDIENAGKTLIRVNDDGDGMPAQDLPLAVLRHTTSKISTFDDMDNLQTFGFRGEALFSVSAISKVGIISAREGQTGSQIKVEAGKVTAQTAAPSVKGTTVEVRDLFFNTPARLKFLKSDTVERSHLLCAAEEAAMANPQVSFNIKTDGAKIYALPAQNDDEEGLRRRISKIIGAQITKDLIFIKNDKFGFRAFVSASDKLIAARDNVFFFINRRPVNCKVLQQAVYKAYQPYRAKEKHPVIILFLQIPPDEFDINIHPQKKEVKFADESEIFNFIYRQISSAVLGKSGVEQINLQTDFKTSDIRSHAPALQTDTAAPAEIAKLSNMLNAKMEAARPLFEVRDFDGPSKYSLRPQETPAGVFTGVNFETKIETKQPEQNAVQNPAQPSWFNPPYNYLGQLHKSYLAFENPQGLVLVDQHAAQERIFFEEYLNSLENNTTQKQTLMFPVNVELSASNVESILAWRDILERAGFEISRFSPSILLISTVPNILKFKDDSLRDFIVSLSGVIGAPSKSGNSLKYKLISTMACKKSIKAGESLDKTQADALMQNLKKCADGLHCPHGRPTLITLDIKEIAKKFGRI
ncbi:MAG: DNA mismatch repair endonuclease MutL [Elusimicrobiota bacterium]|jgi:DNA mismatch repair protein MutL|nr:DNA mismatch repair endonuclease MutL [Elusimicrobiota bacterium]